MQTKCFLCDKHIEIKPSRILKTGNFCSIFCARKSRFSKPENNPNWKGEKVGYAGVHTWIKKNLGTPNKCEHCGRENLKTHQITWANIDHKYKRNLNDWLRLCVSCHWKYDIKNNLTKRWKTKSITGNKILNLLKDKKWHCSSEFIKIGIKYKNYFKPLVVLQNKYHLNQRVCIAHYHGKQHPREWKLI